MKKIAFALVFALSFASCASLPKPLQAAGSAFEACVKGDAPSVSAALLAQVQQLLIAGTAGWVGMLEQLGIAFGEDAVACAVDAAEAGFAAMAAGSATPATGDDLNAAAAARAEQFLKTHGY